MLFDPSPTKTTFGQGSKYKSQNFIYPPPPPPKKTLIRFPAQISAHPALVLPSFLARFAPYLHFVHHYNQFSLYLLSNFFLYSTGSLPFFSVLFHIFFPSDIEIFPPPTKRGRVYLSIYTGRYPCIWLKRLPGFFSIPFSFLLPI